MASRRDVATRGLAPESVWRAACLVAIGLAVAAGLAMRAWFLTHYPTSSDEAVAGLMAQQILHGHFVAFYWGQSYGGVEPYFVALMVRLFGGSGMVLGVSATLLYAVSALVVWRIARHLGMDPMVAGLAGAVDWLGSAIVVRHSTYEYGFRGATLLCGVVAIWLALRLLGGSREVYAYLVFGLVAGLGWWASPEIVYFLIPAGIYVVTALARRARSELVPLVARFAAVVAGAVVGASPWLWSNLHNGFRSLAADKLGLPPHPPNYVSRLGLFFTRDFPMLLNTRYPGTGDLVAGVVLEVVLVTLVVLALVVCLAAPGPTRALAVAVVAFPFLYAYLPSTWFWQDGRYVTYLWPLLCLVLFAAVQKLAGAREGDGWTAGVAVALGWRRSDCSSAGRPARRSSSLLALPRALALGLCVVLASLSLVIFYVSYAPAVTTGVLSGWGNPDGPSADTAAALVRNDLRVGYANYWMAYKLDYLSGGALELTPPPNDALRNRRLLASVRAAHPQSWLFPSPTAAPLIGPQFGVPAAESGPPGLSETIFEEDLHLLGIPYTVTRGLGLVEAVTPARNVRLLPNLHVVPDHG